MVTSQNDNDGTNEQSSAVPSESSPYPADHETKYHMDHNEQSQRVDGSHHLIDSGCIREFASRALGTPTSAASDGTDVAVEIHQIVGSDARQTIETIRKSSTYEQTASLLQKHGGDRPDASEYTLAVTVNIEHHTWELAVFETVYPPAGVVYLILGHSIDGDTGSIAAVIDPESSATEDLHTVTAFEIGTEQVAPTSLTLDKQLETPDNTNTDSSSRSSQIGYMIAIDWFVS